MFNDRAVALPCEDKWRSISSNLASSNLNKITLEWESMFGKCEDRDLYQLRMVILKIENKDYAEAGGLIDSELDRGNKYQKELMLRGVVGLANKAVDENNNSSKVWAKLISHYEGIIKLYPDWWEVYSEYGAILILLEEYEIAEKYVNKSIELNSTVYGYGLLIRLNYKIKKYSDVISIFDALSKSGANIYRISSIMYPVAKAHAELGEFDLAKKAIEVLVDNDETVINTIELDKTIDFINDKIRKAQG